MFDLRSMAKGKVLVSAHRGTWAGNIPCNTIYAFKAALAEGADIIELDISRSLEGTLYVFHPGTEPHFLKSDKLIRDMTDSEVAKLRLVNADGAETQYSVPLFDDVLEELKGKCVINIDKFPLFPEDIVAAVRRHHMVDQALVKTDQDERYYRMMETLAPDFSYMTFAKDMDTDSETLATRKLNYIGTEALFKTEKSEFVSSAYHEKMHKLGLLTWANAIVFNYRTIHSAGHNDDISIGCDPDKGWGYLVDLGYDMIQTDWVVQCIRYLQKRGLRS